MRIPRRRGGASWRALGEFLVVLFALGQSGLTSGALQTEADESNQVQQGSWSHWWSYDGISGPDYWNINKHWLLCTSGRKQSPVNIRTERLVYDHLLGPLRLKWHEDGEAGGKQSGGVSSPAKSPGAEKQPVQLKLINSGRGIEAWLEAAGGMADEQKQLARQAGQPGAQLHLSQGPLSYEYKFFKIELHSASPAAAAAAPGGHMMPAANQAAGPLKTTSGARTANKMGAGDNNARQQVDDNDEIVPEALHAAPTSEHLVDGRAFDGELQLHFYNKHLASSAKEALRMTDEQPLASLFAVISVFISFEGGVPLEVPAAAAASAAKNKEQRPNGSAGTTATNEGAAGNAVRPLDFMLDNLIYVQNQGDAIDLRVPREQIEALLTDRENYIAYQGSLNRPPCAENVDWILMNRALRVAAAKFGQLFERPNTNQENVRPVRQLNGRLLRSSIGPRALASAASEPAASCPGPAGDKLNCSAGHQQQQQQRRHRCDMKPHFAYHLTFNPSGLDQK